MNSESPTQLSVSWEKELKTTALKYHLIGAWVAASFNLLFFATDFLNVPEHWFDFLLFRAAVSSCTLLTLLLRKRLSIPPKVLIFIPFLLISIQNAYIGVGWTPNIYKNIH